jgi:hypothetical protein
MRANHFSLVRVVNRQMHWTKTLGGVYELWIREPTDVAGVRKAGDYYRDGAIVRAIRYPSLVGATSEVQTFANRKAARQWIEDLVKPRSRCDGNARP